MSLAVAVSGALVLNLVVLHRIDGGEVVINPQQVTSLRQPEGKYGHLLPDGNCLIGLTDGKFVMVIEPCAEVKQILESAR